jgi:hypothetical protein
MYYLSAAFLLLIYLYKLVLLTLVASEISVIEYSLLSYIFSAKSTALLSVLGRPPLRPLALALASPSLDRWLI